VNEAGNRVDFKEPRPAFLCFNDWAGVRQVPVEVVGETPKRWRIRAPGPDSVRLAGRRRCLKPGKTALVPKTAVQFSAHPD
jgi:hypothetical protein